MPVFKVYYKKKQTRGLVQVGNWDEAKPGFVIIEAEDAGLAEDQALFNFYNYDAGEFGGLEPVITSVEPYID